MFFDFLEKEKFKKLTIELNIPNFMVVICQGRLSSCKPGFQIGLLKFFCFPKYCVFLRYFPFLFTKTFFQGFKQFCEGLLFKKCSGGLSVSSQSCKCS